MKTWAGMRNLLFIINMTAIFLISGACANSVSGTDEAAEKDACTALYELIGMDKKGECLALDSADCDPELLEELKNSNSLTEKQVESVTAAAETEFKACLEVEGEDAKEQCAVMANQTANELARKHVENNFRNILACTFHDVLAEDAQ